ncbi:MAG: Asp23/Gls24 family envelope stress response protein [Firmicutes bacterium]|jgi:uncharacterized alkaline shock family protein YloU|uniref:Asp23/Gls24 family envelope stress response protein n=1 Tax=Sulfobacillus benefaciens TaxID=453960 RepID=A0A2T2XBJ4_9FIRM|nr:Asp23/Gls24 family envelope stress response protein [Bacillota bacterium]MCL5014785.1 Asp23/Gls24 family envelope stress response protein [Bacillota bacterium]PSR31893.1 MAG: Asp23/Gls24 family envelope stress response protein [Sulfobacillus benefaciens]HBQ96725.1 Asp23/Gls24 family envelope stress response protein [Sulfobacillus sp.]
MTELSQELKTVPSVRVTHDVISAVAAIAATEVQGVAAMSGGLTGGITERLGKKASGRGVKLEIRDTHISLDVYVVVHYGFKIPEVASRIQSRVKQQVETMTGLHVSDVNIHVQGVSFATGEDEPPSEDPDLEP